MKYLLVLISEPPRSGKNRTGEYLSELLGAERSDHFALSDALKRMAHAHHGCIPYFWLGGIRAENPSIVDFGPAIGFEAAFDGEQGVSSRLRSVAFCPFESAADDLLAGAFHDA